MGRKMKDSGIEWIGEIPADWTIKRLKYQFDFGKGLSITKADLVENGIAVISYGQIHSKENNGTEVNDSLIRFIPSDSEVVSPNSLLHKGDFVFADTSEDLDGCGNCVYVDSDNELYAGYHTIILKNKEANGKYLAYLFQTDNWRKQIRAKVSGVKVFSISRKILSEAINIVPPIEVQAKIVAILDEKCREIDAAIKKTTDTMEAYKFLKQSLITRAVTKGIRGEREMKDSGMDWVREIPYEWDSINPKALFKQRKDRAKEGEKQLTASQKYGVIYQDEYMELTGSSVVLVEKDFSILKHVEAGDFVISMRSFQGGLEYSENTGSISSAYVMLIPNTEMVYPPFYKWLFKSSLYINALQSTSDLVRDGQAMRYSNFAKVRLYSVPTEEQCEIAEYLDEKCSAIDTLIAKKEQLLSELEIYKKYLIYEYVTGKREVPA